MKMTFCLMAALWASGAHAQTYQRSCAFDTYVKISDADGMQRGAVDWRTTAARKGRSGRFVVHGSGDYPSRIKTFLSGAMEYVFDTPVSTETVTIGAGGEALWSIDFTNGDMLTYVGSCARERRTD